LNEPQRTQRRIQIVHESLLTKWPRLVRWQTQDAEGAQLRDELRQAAQLWDQHARSQDFLWSGTAFNEFQLWRERYPGGLSALEEAFAEAMQVHAQRRRRRRRIAVTATVGLLTIGLTVVGWLWQRAEASRERAEAEARRSEASKLVVLGERELETHPTGALAYAIKSLESADTTAARLLALRVLQQGPVARIATVGAGDADGAYAIDLDFSPDGEWVATGGYTKSEVLRRDGERRLILGEYGGSAVQSGMKVRFTSRSDALVADLLGEVRVWSIPDGRELRHEQIDRGPSVLFMGDDEFVTLTVVEGKRVFRSWPLGEGEPRLLASVDRFFDWLDIDAARGVMAYTRDKQLFTRPLEDLDAPPRFLARLPAETEWVRFSTGVELAAARGLSGRIGIWSTEFPSEAPLRTLDADEKHGGFGFGRNSRWLAEGGGNEDGWGIRLWDLEGPRGAAPPITLRRNPTYMNSIVFDSSGYWLATAHANDVAFWWLGGDHPLRFRGGGALAFTPDGQSLVCASGDGIRVWPLGAGSAAEPKTLLPGGGGGLGGELAIDPRGLNVAVVEGESTIHVVPLDGSPATRLEGFSEQVAIGAIAFSEDGRLLAAAPFQGPAEEKVIRVFDLATGAAQVLGPVPGTGAGFGGILPLRFAGSSRLLAGVMSGDPSPNHGIVAYDLASGAATVLDVRLAGVYFNPAGTGGVGWMNPDPDPEARAAGTTYEPIRFRLDGTAPEPLRGRGSTFSPAAFDPTGRLLATGGADGVIRVGPVDGEEPHVLTGGPTRHPQGIVFSPDGRLLASSSGDGTIRVWKVPDMSKPPLHTLPLDTLLAKLRTHTNLRAVPDPLSASGYRLEIGPFPGWATPPEW